MFCTSCGQRSAPSSRFCAQCGAPAAVPAGVGATSVAAPVGAPPGAVPPAGLSNGGNAAHAPLSADGRVDNSLAWTLAFAPLILVLVDALLATTSAGSGLGALSFLAAVVLNSALAVVDSQRLKRTGVTVSAALALLIVPAYLFARASKLRQNFAIPIVWCLCLLASLGGAGIVANTVGVAIDTHAVETQIAQKMQTQVGEPVQVDCPSSASPRPGSGFQCIAHAGDQTVMINVTVQNAQGDIVWQTAG